MQALTNQIKLRHLLLITAFACLNTLPFCHRAYWLDEYFYLKSALHIFTNPLFPQDFPEVWFGTKYPTAGFHSHPPLLIYIIWSIVALTRSQAEVYLHLAFLVFPILAGLSSYYLARRFTERPLLATLLIMASPAFIVMSHTIMSDMVFQAFLMAAFAAYIYGLDRDDRRLLRLSSIFMVLACFTSYQGLIFILLLPLYALLHGKLNWRSLRYCAPPFIITVAWMTVGYLHYGKTPVQGTFSIWIGKYLFFKKVLINNLAAATTFLGGTTIFPMASLILLLKLRKTIWYSLALLVSAILAARFAVEYDVANKILFTVLAANGIVMTALVLVESVRPLRLFALQSSHSARPSAFGLSPERLGTSLATLRPSLFLGAWFFVVLLFYITCAEAMRARFLLVLIPPLVFFVINKVSSWRSLLVVLFIMTWLTGLAIAAVDYKFVSTNRTFADYFNSAYGSLPIKKWGAMESGLRYYLEKVGVKVLSDEDDSPRALDVVIRPDKLFKYPLASDLESELVLVEQKSFPAPRAPIRTESMHDSKIGMLPFYLSRRPWDTINIYQVSLAVDKLPEAEITGARERIYPLYWTLEGKTKVALPLPINSRIKYRLTIPPDAAIAFSLARSPRSESPMQFRVAISNNGPSEETCFSQRFDNAAQERQWQRVLIDATRFANREATLVFEVYGDAVKHSADDVVGWADLVIGPKRVLTQ